MYRLPNRRNKSRHPPLNRTVASVQNARSSKAQFQDSIKKAPLAKTEEQWMNDPAHFDLKGVDLPEEKIKIQQIELLADDLFAQQSIAASMKTGQAEEDALRTYVNSVEGDRSQLPPKLADYADKKGWLTQGQVPGSRATYNQATGWMAISFSDIPAPELRAEMKANGFRYNPARKQWVAKWYPFREELAQKYAGLIEQVNIEPNWAAKAEHAETLAAKHEALSDEVHAKADRISDAIPFGQPILIGHHSEARHRKDIDRIEHGLRKFVEERQTAQRYSSRAERYRQKATGEDPVKIHNRIKRLEADLRSFERELQAGESGKTTLYYSGHISPARKQAVQSYIKKINGRLEVEQKKYQTSGGIPTDRFLLAPGDKVKTRFGLVTIKKVSDKTVRVAFTDSNVGICGPASNSLISKTDIINKI